jgi:hypothetical protein
MGAAPVLRADVRRGAGAAFPGLRPAPAAPARPRGLRPAPGADRGHRQLRLLQPPGPRPVRAPARRRGLARRPEPPAPRPRSAGARGPPVARARGRGPDRVAGSAVDPSAARRLRRPRSRAAGRGAPETPGRPGGPVPGEQRLRPVPHDDDQPAGDRDPGEPGRPGMGTVRVPLQARRPRSRPALLRPSHAPPGLADVVRGAAGGAGVRQPGRHGILAGAGGRLARPPGGRAARGERGGPVPPRAFAFWRQPPALRAPRPLAVPLQRMGRPGLVGEGPRRRAGRALRAVREGLVSPGALTSSGGSPG